MARQQTSTNPFADYTLAITDTYQESVIGLIKANKKPKGKSYKSINALLEESFFMGATKFGANYIA